MLDPLFDPTFPVSCEIPELLTSPFVEKSTKSAAVPKLGTCPKSILGIANKTKAINMNRKVVFITLNF